MQVPATITLSNDSNSNDPRSVVNTVGNRGVFNDTNSSYPMDIPEKLTGIYLYFSIIILLSKTLFTWDSNKCIY